MKDRGFIKDVTNEQAVKKLFSKRKIRFYIGFDPTADSLHLGQLIPLMAMKWALQLGHFPICLIGGATGLVGDPSGKEKARPLMEPKSIKENVKALSQQVSKILNSKKILILDNSQWLRKINFIDFLRKVGRHCNVKQMLATEAIETRLKKGLSFLEFSYQLFQAYDFWYLFKRYNCLLQMGGSDQWGNIVAGIELIKKLEGREVYGLTFPLFTTAGGKKMGKTEKGTIWLDAKKTSPYEFYQHWMNIDDRDVEKFLLLFTFLSPKKIKELGKLKGEELKKAKEILAFETTKFLHGERVAKEIQLTSQSLFGKRGGEFLSVPLTIIAKKELRKGILAFRLFQRAGLTKSFSEAKRLIFQGGGYLNRKKIEDPDYLITERDLEDGKILLRAGKKKYHLIKVEDE